jgi:hypothetical protein
MASSAGVRSAGHLGSTGPQLQAGSVAAQALVFHLQACKSLREKGLWQKASVPTHTIPAAYIVLVKGVFSRT